MRTFFIAVILATVAFCCTQQGGLGGAGEGSDSTKGLKTGADRGSNPDVDTNSGNLKGTVRPDGTVTTNTANGAR
jgi:hypothetical protein